MIAINRYVDPELGRPLESVCGRVDLVDGDLVYYGRTQDEADRLKAFMERFYVRRRKWSPKEFMDNILDWYQGTFYFSCPMDTPEPLEFFALATPNILGKPQKDVERDIERAWLKFLQQAKGNIVEPS